MCIFLSQGNPNPSLPAAAPDRSSGNVHHRTHRRGSEVTTASRSHIHRDSRHRRNGALRPPPYRRQTGGDGGAGGAGGAGGEREPESGFSRTAERLSVECCTRRPASAEERGRRGTETDRWSDRQVSLCCGARVISRRGTETDRW